MGEVDMTKWKKLIGKERIYNNNYKGRTDVVAWDVLPINNEQKLELEFLSSNSKYLQGVRLAIDTGEGELEINGIKNRGMKLWENTAPKKVKIRCTSSEGKLSVYNISRDENGNMVSVADFQGMLIEEVGNIRIYRCNDVYLNDNFDKLVFKITKVE